MKNKLTIISGAQTGVDRAALQAAVNQGFPTGGWMPKGFIALDGEHPEYAEEYGIEEMPTSDYGARTDKNVSVSDATLQICSNSNSPGEKRTHTAIARCGKPFAVIYLFPVEYTVKSVYVFDHTLDGSKLSLMAVSAWMNRFKIVNIAGNSSRSAVNITGYAQMLIAELLYWIRKNRQ